MGQKSAEVVVGKDVTTHGSVVAGNKPGVVTDSREDLPCRRTELEERDVILHELPMHVKARTGMCRSASWESSSPR
jgi:hypothetical protein